ncbi:MAG: DUF523 and DUF1722 domain-containing protein [Proteobacteria bacterium]|nr:DUF523 and DUF1722 domain-containing protein [Pseudomonadota bacterium]MBU1545747.1 DUF523 and DUF1722 domain-containing protein [Pseudomonadota bacterium]MBU2618437.1 DUF523 and DUF1722 domain-containing protein [Pseudomonadota bacterium]
METALKIGISACLLGEPVRYDGGHKLDQFLVETLGRFVSFVPVCPETECGLGVPREAMRLTGDPASPRLMTIRTGQDLTARMEQWATRRVSELAEEDLCGFIFKSRSPSSGMERVKVYADTGGEPVKTGVGLFAREFMARLPLLPVEDEGRLHDPVLRENFITRIFVLKRWRDLLAANRSRGGLVAFHTAHKLLLLSHSEKHYRAMGRLVAEAKKMPLDDLFSAYEAMLMEALRLKSSLAKNSNVLLHILGYFKKNLAADERQEMVELIDRYRGGLVPLIVPITLLNHYVRKYDQSYLAGQIYLYPHPLELKLRNHA